MEHFVNSYEVKLTDRNMVRVSRVVERTGLPLDKLVNDAIDAWFSFVRRVARIDTGA